MADDKKNGIGLLILVFGIILLFIGVTLSFYELMTLHTIPWEGKIPHLFTYLYQFVGIALILVGAVFALVGGYRWKSRKKID